VVRELEVGHRPNLELHVWIVASRNGDHLWREIDAEHVNARVMKASGHVTRAAANVGDRSTSGVAHQVSEQRQARAEIRVLVEQSTYLLCVPRGVGVVRRASIREPGVGHG
jgi:hypothetical protein